jgi:hypothetical protein
MQDTGYYSIWYWYIPFVCIGCSIAHMGKQLLPSLISTVLITRTTGNVYCNIYIFWQNTVH